MVGALLDAHGLVRRYAGRAVVDVAALEVRRGEVLSIVGPNGAGKSTLFRLLLLLEQPDAGVIRMNGAPADAASRRRLAGVFQRPILFTGTVADNVGYGLRARRVPRQERRQRVHDALAALDMTEYAGSPVQLLSGGEAQRVALARALVLRPDVLLLDEPTASLDVGIRRRFRQDLDRAGRELAGAVVLVTHDGAEAFGLADRVAVMHHGRIVQDGTPSDVMTRPASAFVAELSGAELLLHGVVEGRDDDLVAVRIAGQLLLWAAAGDAGLAAGDRAAVAYRPEDVLLSPADDVTPTSAVNRVAVTVRSLVGSGGLVRVLLHATPPADVQFAALLTRRSVAALQLGPGTAATAHLKASALHAWAD
jgi:putative spermidine/putrescine transport system ATP-binding protein